MFWSGLNIVMTILVFLFMFSPEISQAVYKYKGKLYPGQTTKAQAEEVLGEPAGEIIKNTFRYDSTIEGIEMFIIEYKEHDSGLVADKIDLLFSKPFKSKVLAESMKLPDPELGKINAFGKYQEFFGTQYSVIFTHKTKSPKSGVTVMSAYSKERFDSLGIKPDIKNEKVDKKESAKTASQSPTEEIAKLPPEAELHFQQGMTYVSIAKASPNTAKENYSNALIEFSNALKEYPKYAEAYSNRGVLYMQQKKYNKAEEDLKKAAEFKPDDPIILYNLAALYSLQKKNDIALDYLDKALQNGFNHFDTLKPKGKQSDPDLANLRKDPEFKKVLEKHKVFIMK